MDPSSAPLADYFWIAGIDSVSYHDLPEAPNSGGHTTNGFPPVGDNTIAEGTEEGQDEPILGSAPRGSSARHSRGSLQRLSRLSIDARNSIQSLEALDTYSGSNRSSLTVRAVPSNGTQDSVKQGLSDFDFDRALFKFANERETFLDDLSFSAGTVMQSRPPMTARAEKIKHDEEGLGGRKSPFGRVGGSIRRKISFRDLNSSKKQTINRSGKLLSTHNWGQGRVLCGRCRSLCFLVLPGTLQEKIEVYAHVINPFRLLLGMRKVANTTQSRAAHPND